MWEKRKIGIRLVRFARDCFGGRICNRDYFGLEAVGDSLSLSIYGGQRRLAPVNSIETLTGVRATERAILEKSILTQ
jgi:hypothetical protein